MYWTKKEAFFEAFFEDFSKGFLILSFLSIENIPRLQIRFITG